MVTNLKTCTCVKHVSRTSGSVVFEIDGQCLVHGGDVRTRPLAPVSLDRATPANMAAEARKAEASRAPFSRIMKAVIASLSAEQIGGTGAAYRFCECVRDEPHHARYTIVGTAGAPRYAKLDCAECCGCGLVAIAARPASRPAVSGIATHDAKNGEAIGVIVGTHRRPDGSEVPSLATATDREAALSAAADALGIPKARPDVDLTPLRNLAEAVAWGVYLRRAIDRWRAWSPLARISWDVTAGARQSVRLRLTIDGIAGSHEESAGMFAGNAYRLVDIVCSAEDWGAHAIAATWGRPASDAAEVEARRKRREGIDGLRRKP